MDVFILINRFSSPRVLNTWDINCRQAASVRHAQSLRSGGATLVAARGCPTASSSATGGGGPLR
eukprot:7215098-Pyramimonas_sp.AAC.1